MTVFGPVTDAMVVTKSPPAGPTPCTVIGAPTTRHESIVLSVSAVGQRDPENVIVLSDAPLIVPEQLIEVPNASGPGDMAGDTAVPPPSVPATRFRESVVPLRRA